MKNNLFYFQWYKILFLTMLIDPIFVIYAYSEGLSANQIFILTSIEAVLIMLLEVPTGVISDLFGYKISMVLSVCCGWNLIRKLLQRETEGKSCGYV